MNFKKIIAVSAAICLSLGIFALRSPAVMAAEEVSANEVSDAVEEGGFFDVAYKATEEYKAGKYYENLKKVPKTGNQAINVIAIALSQVGYHEGNDESDFGGLNVEGNGDFAEYNMIFGKIDYNVRYGYSWCASFATWCLRQAGIDPEQSKQTAEFNEDYKKTYISTWQWKKAFEKAGAFVTDKSYAPEVGDIVFFKDVDDKGLEVDTSHVGIVICFDGENIYTVEGNSNSYMGSEQTYDCVAVKTHSLSSKYIVGYGKPDYKANDESVAYVWRNASNSDSDVKHLSEIIDEARAGVQFVPEEYVEMSSLKAPHSNLGKVLEVTCAAVILVGIGVAITFISITVFGKKPETSRTVRKKK